jgi:orotate phosphoribosyltransferase
VTGSGEWMALLERTGALLSGHFLLSSGLHSSRYVQCARALEDPADAEALGKGLARGLRKIRIDRVISPPLGALLIGYEVARALGRPFSFPERDGRGRFTLRRGFLVQPGERVLVVEDVITTGRTTRELIEHLVGVGADVVAVGAIVDRSMEHAVGGFPIRALVELDIPTYEPATCPHCLTGEPIEKPGSREEREDG